MSSMPTRRETLGYWHVLFISMLSGRSQLMSLNLRFLFCKIGMIIIYRLLAGSVPSPWRVPLWAQIFDL